MPTNPKLPFAGSQKNYPTAFRLGEDIVAELRTINQVIQASSLVGALQISIRYYYDNLPKLYSLSREDLEQLKAKELTVIRAAHRKKEK